jgi:hypothetical protein
MTNCRMDGELDALFQPVPEQEQIIGAIQLKDCHFDRALSRASGSWARIANSERTSRTVDPSNVHHAAGLVDPPQRGTFVKPS